MTEPIDLSIGGGNTPNKRQLTPPPGQARAIRRVMNHNDIDVLSGAEGYTALRQAFRKVRKDVRARRGKPERARYAVTAARPNSVLHWGKVGNILIHDTRVLSVVRKDQCHLKFGRRTLHFPVVTYEVRGTEERIVVAGAHFPIKRDASQADWDRMVGALAEFAQGQARRDGATVVVMPGDFNRDAGTVDRALPGAWNLGAYDQVMQVWFVGGVRRGADVVRKGYGGVISDHRGLPVLRLRVPRGR